MLVQVTDAVGSTDNKWIDIKVKPGMDLDIRAIGTPCGNGFASNEYVLFSPDIEPFNVFDYPTDYFWDFGDGTTHLDNYDGSGFIEHKYANTGCNQTYNVTLTVTDPNGSMQASKVVNVCGSGGTNCSTTDPPVVTGCNLEIQSSPGSKIVSMDYEANSSYSSSETFDVVNLPGDCWGPNYAWSLSMVDCGYGQILNTANEACNLSINQPFFELNLPGDCWKELTGEKRPWGCVSLIGHVSNSSGGSCCAPVNNCIAYIVPSDLTVSELEVTGSCNDFEISAHVDGGGWFLEGGKYTYKEFIWKAYDVNNQDIEINILTLIPDHPDRVEVNLNASYFEQFGIDNNYEFIVKLTVKDFANQTIESNQFLSLRPFRLYLESDYTRCPDSWSYFEDDALVSGGTGIYEFSWSVTQPIGSSLDFESNDPTDLFPYFKSPAVGSKEYSLSVNMLDETGAILCQLQKQITVTSVPLNLTMPTTSGACFPVGAKVIGPTNLNLGGSGKYGFEWTTANPDHLNYLSDVFSPNPVIQGVPPGDVIVYTLTVGDLTSPCSATAQTTITGYINDLSVFIIGPQSPICNGTAVELIASPSPYLGKSVLTWTSNNPHFNPPPGNSLDLVLTSEVNSFPGDFLYTIRYLDAQSGCYVEDEIDLTILPRWTHQGYEPLTWLAVAGSQRDLWLPYETNKIITPSPFNNANKLNISWFPTTPTNIQFNGGSIGCLSPRNGKFVPTTTAPQTTMSVELINTGCSKNYKSIKYIVTESKMDLSATTENAIVCSGDEVCFDVKFDLHLLPGQISAIIPPYVDIAYTIKQPGYGSGQSPKTGYIRLDLESTSGLYTGTLCVDNYFIQSFNNSPNLSPANWYSVDMHLVNKEQFGPQKWYEPTQSWLYENVETTLLVLVSNGNYYPNPGPITTCIITEWHRVGTTIDMGIGGIPFSTVCSNGTEMNREAEIKARDYINIHPHAQISLVPNNNGIGAHLYIDPCIPFEIQPNEPDSEKVVIRSNDKKLLKDLLNQPDGALSMIVQPNPFTDQVRLIYSLGKMQDKQDVTLSIYDITGRLIQTIEHRKGLESGQYQTDFNTGSIPSGVYLYELKLANGKRIVQKAIKQKL